jgi:hypothetical protein
MTLINIIFFAFMSRVLGGMFTKPNTTENSVPRWLSLTACFVVLAINVYPDVVSLVAWCAAFYVIRIQSTHPLLDASNQDKTEAERKKGLRDSVVRNAWILPLLPFTSWWLVIFLAQGGLYYIVGKYRDRFYNKLNPTAISEILTGAMIGSMI